MRRELSEKEILDTVRDIRHEAPGIGAYKLYLMLKELYPDGIVPGLVLRAAAQVAADAEAREAPSHDKLQPSLQEVQNMIKELTSIGSTNCGWPTITYIDTDEGVAYLHLLTDAFTHEDHRLGPFRQSGSLQTR